MITRKTAVAYVESVRELQELKHTGHTHTVPEWLIITRRQLQKVEDAWHDGKPTEALHRFAHVAACGVAAVEQNGEAPTPDAR